MRTVGLAPWILAAILASTACHGPETEVEQGTTTTSEVKKQPSTTAKAQEQPTTTAKIEECSWCPAPDPSGTTATHQPASSQADLIDEFTSASEGTAFADVSEDELLADIRTICEMWKGNASLRDVAAEVAAQRAELIGIDESAHGLEAYTQLMETSADQRCLRDPMR